MPDINQVEAVQQMMDKNGYTAVIACLVVAVVGLFLWLMWIVRKMGDVQESRIRDRDESQKKLDELSRDTAQIVQENTQSLFVLTRVIEEIRDSRRGHRVQPASVTPPPKEGAG